MSDLSAKFSALEAQLASQATATQGYIDTVEEKLQSVFDQLDLMLINNAVNTRALLQAIAANSPCAPCPTPSLVVPPTTTTPVATNPDKCKRIQAFLHAMQSIFTVLDTMSAFSVPFSPSLILDAIGEVITALENGDETPLPSFPEAVQIVGDGINYVAGNLLVGGNLSSDFSSILLDLRDGMFAASTPAAMQSAYNAVVDASGLPSYVKPLMRDAAYNELYSYYFDVASEPNLGGYDGTACGEFTCYIFGASDWVTVSSEDGPKTIPDWSIYGLVADNNPGHTNPVWVSPAHDWSGWCWTVTGGSVYHQILGNEGSGGFGDIGCFDVDPTFLTATFIKVSGTPAIEICPPE